MRKNLIIIILSFVFFSPFAMAEVSTYDAVEVPEVKTPPSVPASSHLQQLNRIREVERQLNYVEQQNRLQQDQIRRLERAVDDLKRRR